MGGVTKAGGCEPCRSSVKGKAGECAVEARINSAGICNKNGNMRMCGMKHNYNGHKTDE